MNNFEGKNEISLRKAETLLMLLSVIKVRQLGTTIHQLYMSDVKPGNFVPTLFERILVYKAVFNWANSVPNNSIICIVWEGYWQLNFVFSLALNWNAEGCSLLILAFYYLKYLNKMFFSVHE